MDLLHIAQPELNSSSRSSSGEYELQTGEKDTAGVTPSAEAAMGLIPFGLKDPDEEMANLEHEIKKLEEEEKLLVKSQKLQELRKAVSEKKKAVKKLRGRTLSSENKLGK